MRSTVNPVTKGPFKPYLAEQKGYERGRLVMFISPDEAVIMAGGENNGWGREVGDVIKVGEDEIFQIHNFEHFYGTVTVGN